MKKIKKIKLNIDTISNLTEEKMKDINGGGIVIGSALHSCACGNNASNYATGTGYGMCCCNATANCSH